MAFDEIYLFDAYGTLLDVHSAAARLSGRIGPVADRLSEIWRAKQLEYTWVYAATGQRASFWTLSERSLDYAIAISGASIDDEMRAQLLDAYRELSAYRDVAPALKALKARGARLAILSNGDPDLLERLVDCSGLDGLFDRLLSVADAGTFKPHAAVYRLAVEAFDAPPDAMVFCSSNRWDIAGASAFGFRSIWVNRLGRPDEYPEMRPEKVISTLEGLLSDGS
ncbi:MAG TPA: haloacid dehalogenase type II [Hyphomicrobiaceae bacterium]|nr:haloacid dehalogenase type II [Hyphomicrobiaceae bacterium]